VHNTTSYFNLYWLDTNNDSRTIFSMQWIFHYFMINNFWLPDKLKAKPNTSKHTSFITGYSHVNWSYIDIVSSVKPKMQFARSQHTSKEISKTYNLKNNLWKVIHNNFLFKSNKNQSMVCKSSSKCHFLKG